MLVFRGNSREKSIAVPAVDEAGFHARIHGDEVYTLRAVKKNPIYGVLIQGVLDGKIRTIVHMVSQDEGGKCQMITLIVPPN